MSRTVEINSAYSLWAEQLVDKGWNPYLLTFMFAPLGGSPVAVAQQIECEVERVYATLLPRIVRNPTRPAMAGKLPIWFCAHDRPVIKRAKQSLRDVVVNDGHHAHAAAFLPPWSRLGEDLDEHVEHHHYLYIRPGLPLDRLDVVPITHDVGYVVDYARKFTVRSLLGQDASFVLPRSLGEVCGRAA